MKQNTNKSLKSILFLTNGFPLWGKYGAGGIGEFTYNIAKELSSKKIHVYVLGCSKLLEKNKILKFTKGNMHAVVFPYINFPKGADHINRLLFLFRIFRFIAIKKIQVIIRKRF